MKDSDIGPTIAWCCYWWQEDGNRHEEDMDGNPARVIQDMYEALESLLAEWDGDRFEWIENRPDVLAIQRDQGPTGGTYFEAARAVLARAREVKP